MKSYSNDINEFKLTYLNPVLLEKYHPFVSKKYLPPFYNYQLRSQ